MAWDDAPPTVAELKLKPPTVSWDDAPPTPEELGKTEMTLKGLAKNAVSDVGGMIKGLGDTINQGAYEIPKTVGKSLDQSVLDLVTGRKSGPTPLSEKMNTIEENAPEMAREMVRPVTDFKKYSYEHPVSQAMNAAALIGVGGSALEMAGKAAPVMAAGADVAANTMARRALGFTKRFLNTEGKAANASEAAHIALQEKVITPGATPEVMMERANALQARAGDAMGEVLNAESRGAKGALPADAPVQFREGFLFDPKKAIKKMEKLRPRSYSGKVLEGGDYTRQNAAIDDAIETIKAHGERPLPWGEANDLKGELQSNANWDTTKSTKVNKLKKSVGGVFRQSLDDQLTTVMEESGRDIRPFMSAKRIWKAADDMRDALQNRLSSEMGNKGLGLTDLLTASVGSIGGPGYAIASVLVKKALEKFGATVGATSAAKVGAILRAAPELLGEFGTQLKSAAKSGMEAFQRTHSDLLKNPEYRQAVSKIEELAAAPVNESGPVADATTSAPQATKRPVPDMKPNPQSAARWAEARAKLEAAAPQRAAREAAIKATKEVVRPEAPIPDTRVSLPEFASDFANREGVPAPEAKRWMSAYKRSPQEAFQMISDYSSKTIKNQAAARKWRLDIRQQLAEDAKNVKVGGLNRKQVKRFATAQN